MSQRAWRGVGTAWRRTSRITLIVSTLILQTMALQVLTGCGRGDNSEATKKAATSDTTAKPSPVSASTPGSDQASGGPTFDAQPIPAAPVASSITLPQGTAFTVTLQTRLGTKTSRVGDRFDATVASAVLVDGRQVVPAGAKVTGRVVLSEQPGKASGRGKMRLAFDRLSFGGNGYDLGTRSVLFQSRSGARKDRELVGGGAAAGAIVGGIIGGSLGDAAKGAVIGGAAGTGVALATRGPQLEFAPGTRINFRLDQAVEVQVSPTS